MLKTKKAGDKQKAKAQKLMGEIDSELKTRFSEIAKSNSPSTGKSIAYEEAVARFLGAFFDSYYEFHTRVELVDHLLDVEELFPGNLNEWDVVAVYRSAIPSGLLSPGAGKSIAFDSVAFIVQVAQDLTTEKLANDFERFETLSRLGLSDMRKRGLVYSSPYVTGNPLKVLMYGNSRIAKNTLEAELNKHPSGFDCLVVVDNSLLVLGPANPFSTLFREDGKPGLVIANGEALFYLLTNLFVGVQRYSSIDLFRTLWNVRNAAIGQEMVSEDR